MNIEQRERAGQMKDASIERARQQDIQTLQAALQPGIHRQNVELLAHCGNILGGCSDAQERVPGIKTIVSQSYRDGGDDGPHAWMVERSWEEFEFANEDDANCKTCGNRRQIGESERPVYEALSGHDPKGLLKIAQAFLKNGGVVPQGPGAVFQAAKTTDDERVAALEQQVADLSALIGNGHAESPVEAPAAASARGVKGYRKRGDGRYEALLYRSESETGKQRSLGKFDTPEEAIAAREAAL